MFSLAYHSNQTQDGDKRERRILLQIAINYLFVKKKYINEII